MCMHAWSVEVELCLKQHVEMLELENIVLPQNHIFFLGLVCSSVFEAPGSYIVA